MKHHRLYFDSVPLIQIRDGKFEDIPLTQPDEWQDPNGHAIRMTQRFKQFPALAVDMKKHWKRKKTPMLRSLIPGFTQEPQSSHSYSFPSWSEQSRPALSGPRTPEIASGAGRSRTSSADGSFAHEPRARHGSDDSRVEASNGAKTCKNDFSAKRKLLFAGLPPEKQVPLLHFQEWGEAKYGHMLALWRKLDKDGGMTITKAEFLKGVNDLNYPGKAATLWSIYDSDHTGLLTITEFVPVAALQLAKFKHWADEKFGSVQNGFHHFDNDHNGKMTMQEFVQGCHAQDFPSELKDSVQALFAVMDDGRGAGKANVTADEMAFLDAWKCPDYLWVQPDNQARAAFQHALAARHGGNHIIAWRKALDKDKSMRVSFSEFTETSRNLARHGVPEAVPARGVSALFCAVDQCRRGWFTLRDWHEESWNLLARFRQWVLAAYPKEKKVSDCFKDWDTHSSSAITIGTFKSHVQTLDMTSDEKEYLFEGLSLQVEAWSEEKNRYAFGTLTRAELKFLDAWDPETEKQEAVAWDEQLNSSPIPDEQTRNRSKTEDISVMYYAVAA